MSQTHVDSDGGSATIPRWVKIFGIIALALVLLVGAMMLAGGEHGPGRHTPPASVTESSNPAGHVPPIEHSTQQP
jgi:hypothetical protein